MERVNYKVVYSNSGNKRRFITRAYQAIDIAGVIKDLQDQGYMVKGIIESQERFIDIATLILNNI